MSMYADDMEQGSSTIRVIKSVPSDQLATRVLLQWYRLVQPKWKRPLDWIITIFFVLMTGYSFFIPTLPVIAYIAMGGAVAAVFFSWFYVLLLAKVALATNKKVPNYHVDKEYSFAENHLTFSCTGTDPIDVPYDRFTELCQTTQALLFLHQKKLVLWLPLDLLTPEQLQTVKERFAKRGVCTQYLA